MFRYLLNKSLPHKPPCWIVGKRKVNCFVKHLLKLFLGTFLRLIRAPNNSHPCLICNPFSLPSNEGLFYSSWIIWIILLDLLSLLTFFLLFLSCKDLFAFIHVDYSRLILFCRHHNHSYHFFTIWFVTIIDITYCLRA